MTQQPLPPRGDHVPPPSSHRQVRRPRGANVPVAANYTSWFARVSAWIIDSVPLVVLLGVGFGLLVGTQETRCVAPPTVYDLGDFCSTGASTFGQLSMTVAALCGLAYVVWNYGYRQGVSGSTVGKSVMRFKVVGEKTGRPMGFGRSLVRQLTHLVDALPCYVGFLSPIWDAKRQTFADKIVKTVCVPNR